MAPLRPSAALVAVSALLCGCGPSGAGGTAASSQAAASSAPPAASSAASDAAAAFALPPVAAAPAPPPPPPPQVSQAAAPKREPTPAELLRDDPVYVAKGHRIDALYQNARERDPTGQVDHQQAAALAELHACPNKACLDRWFTRREAELKQYVEQ
jgi:hypothetical protein